VTWPNRQVNMKVGPGLIVRTDPMLLQVVWDDLLGNAWKFTSKQERAAIEVGTMSYNGRTAYFVRDNGAGFDMAYVDKLFTPFQRLHTIMEHPAPASGWRRYSASSIATASWCGRKAKSARRRLFISH